MTKKVLISLDDINDIALNFNGEFIINLENWVKHQPAAPQWVKVEDGLPPIEYREGEPDVRKHVFINVKFTEHNYITNRVAAGWYDYSCGKWVMYDFTRYLAYPASVGDVYRLEITHWMPIPPLPEVE